MINLYALYYQYVRSQEELGYAAADYEDWLYFMEDFF